MNKAVNVTKTIFHTAIYWIVVGLLTSHILAGIVYFVGSEETVILPIWEDSGLYLSLFLIGLLVAVVFEFVMHPTALLMKYRTGENIFPAILVHSRPPKDTWVNVHASYVNKYGDCLMKRPRSILVRLPEGQTFGSMEKPYRYIRKVIGPIFVSDVRRAMAAAGVPRDRTDNGFIHIDTITKVT